MSTQTRVDLRASGSFAQWVMHTKNVHETPLPDPFQSSAGFRVKTHFHRAPTDHPESVYFNAFSISSTLCRIVSR